MTPATHPRLVLGPVLRYVDATTATVWVETSVPTCVEVLGYRAPTFTVEGHHFALVLVRGLVTGTSVEYEVHVDSDLPSRQLVWPTSGSTLPPSVIRPRANEGAARIVFGSCRAAAPHHPPYVLVKGSDDDARGVDALWATARRMIGQPSTEWPDLAVFLGDQVYADDTSPRARERIEARRERLGDAASLPDDVVADFEEYTWLYDEAWGSDVERWFLSVVPSMMIFDDHDMIDDWNISSSWVQDIREEPWWKQHIIGGLVSYWIYQHLGNLSPDDIVAEGMLAEAERLGDATDYLRQWAWSSERFTPLPGGYRFSHDRRVGTAHVVMVDCRNGRVLDPGARRMVDHDEWAWVRDRVMEPCEHLFIATSLPVFVPSGVHGLQQWNESLCAGAWGRRASRWSERLRRSLDLEDWSAFATSFDEMCALLSEVTTAGTDAVPRSISVMSGDIHFAYVAEVTVAGHGQIVIHQIVSSPMRNALAVHERAVMRFAGHGIGGAIGRLLARVAMCARPRHRFDRVAGPIFANNIGSISITASGRASLEIEAATWDATDERPILRTEASLELT